MRAGSELGPQQKRIVELEAQVGALHAHVASLEEELGSRASAAAGEAAGAGAAAARAEAAEARCRGLEAEAERLGREVALLQERVGRGEYNAATTRVLHFKYNPEVGPVRCTGSLAGRGAPSSAGQQEAGWSVGCAWQCKQA